MTDTPKIPTVKDDDAAPSNEPLFSFELSRGVLRAMALFQADESRVSLCAVSFEIVKKASGHHEITLASTNGRVLASYNTEIIQDSLFGEMPDALQMSCDLSGVKKLPKNGEADRVTVSVFKAHVEFSSPPMKYTAKRIEAEHAFPAWRAIIPTGKPETSDFFTCSAKLLGLFGAASKLIGDKANAISIQSMGKDRPLVIQLPDDAGFYGLLMPMKDVEWRDRPTWCEERPKSNVVEFANGVGDGKGAA